MKVKQEKMMWKGKPSIRVSIKSEGTETNEGYEIFTLEPIFTVLSAIFESEDLRYPNGLGRTYLLNAIKEIHNKVPLEKVLKKYKIPKRVTKLGDVYEW